VLIKCIRKLFIVLYKCVAACLNHYMVTFRPSKRVKVKIVVINIILRARCRYHSTLLHLPLKYGNSNDQRK